MKHTNLSTFLLIVACLLAPCLYAEDAPQTGKQPTVLIDATHHNGSFEKTLRPWYNYAYKCKVTDHGIRSEGDVPDGKSYAYITVTGNDVSRLDGRFETSLNHIKPENGKAFHLTCQAKVRSLKQYNGLIVNLILQDGQRVKGDDGKIKVKRSISQVLTTRVVPFKSTDWTPIDLDFRYEKDKPFNMIGVRISFLRMGATGSLIEGEAYLDNVVLTQQEAKAKKKTFSRIVNEKPAEVDLPTPPIPIHFNVPKDGYVTLVLEDAQGHRVRNLFGGVFYKAGNHTFDYDGTDIGIPKAHAQAGTGYAIVRSLVKPGTYTVRGLVRDKLGLTYDMTVYPSCGNPPWPTDINFGAGGWLADHGQPRAVAFIPTDYCKAAKPHLVLTCGVAEAAQAVAWVDLDGNKFAGRRRIGGYWTGATLLAVDHGAKRDKHIYLYSAIAWNKDASPKNHREPEIRIMGFSDAGIFRVSFIHPKLPKGKTWRDVDLGGLAIHDGILVYSDRLTGKINVLDASHVTVKEQAKLIGTIDMADAGGMRFDQNGKLLILVGNELHRYTLDTTNCKLTDKQVLISQGLDAPRQITLDGKHNLYISNQGQTHNVKVYGPNGGKLLRTIGKPGVPASGKYDELHMNNPDGIAIDSSNHLWVMEDFRTPKRVSVWTLDGKLVNAFYGPPGYGGGGMIDPTDPTRFYLSQTTGGMEFKINIATGKVKLDRIYWLKSETPFYAGRWHGPQTVMTTMGHRYVTSNYDGPTTGNSLATLWRDDKERITPLAIVGSLRSWPYIEEQGWLADIPEYARFAKENEHSRSRYEGMFKANTYVCWVDLNHDKQVQREEVQLRNFSDNDNVNTILTTHIQPDLSLLVTNRNGVMQIKPREVDSDGLPHYDLADAKAIITGISHTPTSGGGQAFTDNSGMIVFTGGPMRGFKNGQLVWQYHSQWPGLHPGHASPASPSYPGELLATTRLLGPTVTPKHSDVGEIWAINSDKGLCYLLTTDGLFVSHLGAYPRDGRQWNMQDHNRGMDLTDVNMFSEHFFPTINQLPDGEIDLVAGKSHSSIVKVNGLESIKRLPATKLTITPENIRQVQQYMIAREQALKGSSLADSLTVTRRSKPIKVDGKLDDWDKPQWVLIDAETFKEGDWGTRYKEPAITAAMSVDQSNLYIAILSRHHNLTDNSGTDLQTLFKTGGGIDLKLATLPVKDSKKRPVAEGDLRLLMTQNKGKVTAGRYRYIVPGTTDPIAFTSPVMTITVDKMDDVGHQIQMKVGRAVRPTFTRPEKKAVYEVVEIAVPLSVLHWDPNKLPNTTGDIGVLIGKSGETVERLFWHNKAAGIVADIPSEAMITPQAWGKVQVK